MPRPSRCTSVPCASGNRRWDLTIPRWPMLFLVLETSTIRRVSTPRPSCCTSAPCASGNTPWDPITPSGLSAEQPGGPLPEQGKYAEAEPLYQRALRIREQALGPDHPQVAYPLNGLANLYQEQGKYAEAEPLYQRALHIREQALGPDHPLTQEVVRNYAILLRKMWRNHEAGELEARFPTS